MAQENGNAKRKTEFLTFLLDNLDENGDSIVTNLPLPNALVPNPKAYSSMFSMSSSIQTFIESKLDSPKWNEITITAFLREKVAVMIKNHTSVHILRSNDLCNKIFNFSEAEWGKIFSTATPNDEVKLRETVSHVQSEQQRREVEKQNLETQASLSSYSQASLSSYSRASIPNMNASYFFALLFTDDDLNKYLQIEQKVLIGNALIFAIWKEQMEADYLLHKDTRSKFYEFFGYKGNNEADSIFFDAFCNGSMNQKVPDNAEDMEMFLSISPWCGFNKMKNSISNVLKTKIKVFQCKGTKERKALFNFLLQCILETSDIADLIVSWEKRKNEDQMFLLDILYYLSLLDPVHTPSVASLSPNPSSAENIQISGMANLDQNTPLVENIHRQGSGMVEKPSTNSELLKLKQDLKEVIKTNMVIETRDGLTNYMQQGIELIQNIQNNKKFELQLKNTKDTLTDYTSSAIAKIVKSTGEKLMYDAMKYLIALGFIYESRPLLGLFASVAKNLV